MLLVARVGDLCGKYSLIQLQFSNTQNEFISDNKNKIKKKFQRRYSLICENSLEDKHELGQLGQRES